MNKQDSTDKIYTLPKFEMLSPYWKKYFLEIDQAIQENFWGNLVTLKNAERDHDVYIQQLKEMGYCFTEATEAPATFYQAMQWVFENFYQLLDQGTLAPRDILWPARVFEVRHQDGTTDYLFKVIGEAQPDHVFEVNLVTPHVFATMLAQGYFPLGSPIREHTNQTLAEHDLAHFGGFISAPTYMRAVREAFRKVCKKMHENERLSEALQDFNSVYSLRLYYMIEIFTLIQEPQKEMLQHLLEMNLAEPVNLNAIITMLEKKAANPPALYRYLYRIYEHFNELVNPVGGESRDILNRVRKFNRSSRLGNFFSELPHTSSKFDGSSIYSLYLNGCAALENKRSTHPDFLASLREIHAPFIGTLIGTSQLTVEDWVLQAVEEVPDKGSKLYQYLCKSGIWNEAHLIYWVHGCADYTHTLANAHNQKKRQLYV